MRKKERAQVVLERLNDQYPETPVPLDHSDSFTLLIAVLLSAQCTDKKVNEVTPALFAAGPDPSAMAQLEEQQILEHIRQLGLAKTKAKNVRRLAQLLLERHDGEVPQSFEALEALPGVGHKTASVVMFPGFRRTGLSSGYPYSPSGPALGTEQRRQRAAHRARPQGSVPTGGLESTAPADHFLRAGVLHRPRLRRSDLPDVPGVVSKPPQTGDHTQSMIVRGRPRRWP